MQDTLPSQEEIEKLPPDGGRDFNRLVFEKSPYLLQHAGNPVNWYPWGAEAFEKARKEDRPIFLSAGYSACHWCHVMARESFENGETAAILNEYFLPVKVDREERPEVDDFYMKATQLLTGGGGWPNSVFLTPDGKPWFAGTYFPPEDRWGRPGFPTVLRDLAEVWRTRRKEVEEEAGKIWAAMEKISTAQSAPADSPPGEKLVEKALAGLEETFDRERGGFSGAPKFPPHAALRLLLEEYRRKHEPALLEMATVTLDFMARGGIRDHLGGGFHRYSTDDVWFVPHFEKMLYDNAQLIRSYADGYLLSGRAEFRSAAVGIADWVLREMRDEAGGFYSALDADSEGEEGRFYVWRRGEIIEALGEREGELFCRVYGIKPGGNWRGEGGGENEGTNILFLPRPLSRAAEEERIPPEELGRNLAGSRRKLMARRDRRVRPHLDDKIMTDWNGLMIGGLAYAGQTLDETRLLIAAEGAARFLLDNLRVDGRLLHTYRKGEARIPAYLDDYAFLAEGLLELHAATGQEEWLEEARSLSDVMLECFRDKRSGGLFFTASTDKHAAAAVSLFRSRDPYDRAVPSGNGIAALVLIRLARLTGEERYREEVRNIIRAFRLQMEALPAASGTLILAAAGYHFPPGA